MSKSDHTVPVEKNITPLMQLLMIKEAKMGQLCNENPVNNDYLFVCFLLTNYLVLFYVINMGNIIVSSLYSLQKTLPR